ncbi:hypothetical protein J3R30DRAFT_3512926 [Lentinula aciculospora]|uniref:Uncharacterized protein n=1 Tax=Lentinula aciculospora TaxID=153920 RepID=A0A9W9DJ25_9AGAR|nr:hypothetical protein J3R30DRAFT_3512926 [Lentinula aciculospora]
MSASHKPLSTTSLPRPNTMEYIHSCYFSTFNKYNYHPTYIGCYDVRDHLCPDVNEPIKDDTMIPNYSSSESSIPSLSCSDISPEELHEISCIVPLLSSGDFLPDHRRSKIRRLEAAYEEFEEFSSPEERAIVQATFNLLLRKKEEEEKQKKQEQEYQAKRFMLLQQARLELLRTCVAEIEAVPAEDSSFSFYSFDRPSYTLDHGFCGSMRNHSIGEYMGHDTNYHEAARGGHWPPSAPSSPNLPHPSHIFPPQKDTWPPDAPPACMLPDPKLIFQHY